MRDYRDLMIDDIISMEATPEAEAERARGRLTKLSDDALGERLRGLAKASPSGTPLPVRLGLRVVMMGPPGSGKGTQAVRVAARFEVPHLSTGDLLRAAVAARTDVGLRIAERMTTGALIDDDTVVAVTEARLAENDCRRGFVLDGYPRTVGQAEALARFLKDRGLHLDAVVDLEVDRDHLLQRVEARAASAKAKGESVRADDTAEVLAERLRAYRELTAPLTAHYGRDPARYRRIDGNRSIPDVAASIDGELDAIHAAATARRDVAVAALERMVRGALGPAAEGADHEPPPAYRSRFSVPLAFALGAGTAFAVFAIRLWWG